MKAAAAGRGALRIAGSGRDIDKIKKLKVVGALSVQERAQELLAQAQQTLGALTVLKLKTEPQDAGTAEDMDMSIARKRKAETSTLTPVPLTGAPTEARQEK